MGIANQHLLRAVHGPVSLRDQLTLGMGLI